MLAYDACKPQRIVIRRNGAFAPTRRGAGCMLASPPSQDPTSHLDVDLHRCTDLSVLMAVCAARPRELPTRDADVGDGGQKR